MVFVVEVEDNYDGDDEDDEDGGDGGGFPPLTFELFSSSFLASKVPSPYGGLEPSPAIPTVNTLNINLTILFMYLKSLLTYSSSECP